MNQSFFAASREETLRRIRGEYLEMPGLCLTQAQAQRLWGLDAPTCTSALAWLTGEKFLFLRRDGTYGRVADCTRSPENAGAFLPRRGILPMTA